MKRRLSPAGLERELAKNILTGRERLLMALLFEPPADDGAREKKVRRLTDHYDPDDFNMNYSLMLAVLGFRTGWKHFPEDIVPRLKGIHRYCQAKNVMGMPWLLEKIRLLRSRGIPVMLLKGLAMRYYYAPKVPRIMHDYDIAVPRDRFREAMELLHDGEAADKNSTRWSDTIIGRCAGNDIELDVHQWIFKEQGDRDPGLWDRALPVSLMGADVLVPCPEDMMVHLLNNQAGNFFRRELSENRMKWLFDCRTIAEGHKPDPDRIAAYAAALGAEYTSRLMLVLYACCFRDGKALALARRIQPMNADYAAWLYAKHDYQRELERWRSYGYKPYGPVDVKRLLRAVRLRRAEYRVYRCRPFGDAEIRSLVQYHFWKRGIRDWKDFLRMYLGRLSFDGVRVIGKGSPKA